jgi:hypothetical protein
MTDPVEIARKLTKAQREALLRLPLETFRPCDTGFRWPTVAVLKARGMLIGEGYGRTAKCRFTKRGLAVRAELEKM